MKDNFVLKVVEPGTPPSPTPTPTPTPVDPGTGVDPAVPNTGLFTHGIGGPEATIIGVAIILAIAAIVVAVLYRKHKKQGKVTKLVHLVDQTKAVIKSKKRITAGLSAIALLASASTLAVLLVNSGKSNTIAAEGDDELTVDISGNELTVEVGDEPVFAVAEVTATVAEATTSGYTLTAYTDSTDLVSTTDESSIVPMVTTDEGELVALAENTYGLSLVKPESKDEEAYTTLSIDADNPTFITDKDYEATEANDTTTIYYGFYITPDTPYGTYEGSDVAYAAIANPAVATVTFDGNGLYFNGDESDTTNVMRYIANKPTTQTTVYSHTPNVNDVGEYTEYYPTGSAQTFVYKFANAVSVTIDVIKTGNDSCCGPDSDDYFSFWDGAHADYTAAANYGSGVKLSGSNGKYQFGNSYDGGSSYSATVDSDAITVAYHTGPQRGTSTGENYGLGYYAKITAKDADGNEAVLISNEIFSGEYEAPATASAYRLQGWSEDPDAMSASYADAQDVALYAQLNSGENLNLYAVWDPIFEITYAGNGADATTDMADVSQYTTDLTTVGRTVDLLAPNYQRAGYGFAGWSMDVGAWEHLADDDATNDPDIYGPNQILTIDRRIKREVGDSRNLILNAVWADPATDATGNTLTFQTENLLTTTLADGTTLASKPNGYVTALKDERDEEVYAVAKLADGNYWMIENLRLDNEPELSTTNTHNPSLPLTNNYSEGTTSNFLSTTSNDWCTNRSAECYNQSNLNTNNVANAATSPTFSQDYTGNVHSDFSTNLYSYGNYYNWYSATAGNGKQETTTTVTGDICPAGWHLPYGGSQTSEKGGNTSGGFYYLNNLIGGNSNAWRSFPNNFVYSGHWSGSSVSNRGYSGYYQSSTAYDAYDVYYLRFGSEYVDQGVVSDYKHYGNSVRCVAQVE